MTIRVTLGRIHAYVMSALLVVGLVLMGQQPYDARAHDAWLHSMGSSDQVALRAEADRWFDLLLELARRADAAYDQVPHWPAGSPQTYAEAMQFVEEALQQIMEEGGSSQLIPPLAVVAVHYPPFRRSAVAGSYNVQEHIVMLNDRYLTASWGAQSWLSVVVHELVHAQGYFGSLTSTHNYEAQTEIVATEVVAAMANLNYPGMRASILQALRGDALSMAYYIARYEGGPVHTTEGQHGGMIDPLDMGQETSYTVNTMLMRRLHEVRHQLLTPDELRRSDKRLRFWEDRADEYARVLNSYVARVLTVILDAACASGTIEEPFTRYFRSDPIPFRIVEGGRVHTGFKTTWTDEAEQVNLRVDDIQYVLDEIGFDCGPLGR